MRETKPSVLYQQQVVVTGVVFGLMVAECLHGECEPHVEPRTSTPAPVMQTMAAITTIAPLTTRTLGGSVTIVE
jgi:hypothetical protein